MEKVINTIYKIQKTGKFENNANSLSYNYDKDFIDYTNFISNYSLCIKNASDESEEKIGLIESYDYIVINNNTSAIINQLSFHYPNTRSMYAFYKSFLPQHPNKRV